MRITHLDARTILNSRCEWTVEVELNGTRTAAPSGASTGTHEAVVVDAARAVETVRSLAPLVVGKDFTQEGFDRQLEEEDGTPNFSRIGGNTAVALSCAFYNAGFTPTWNVFPFPLGNVFGGGSHGGFADIQEFLILPAKARTIAEAAETSVRFYRAFKKALGTQRGINDEGALIADLPDEKAFEMLLRIAEDIPVRIGIDMAATTLWDGQHYVYKSGQRRDAGDQIDFVADLAQTYRLFYMEDALHEEDFSGFAELTRKVGSHTLVCGDDLTVTNTDRLEVAVQHQSITAIIIKPNQTGTITRTQKAVRYAEQHHIMPVISHRSGETDDVTISRLAVGLGIPIIKAGIAGMRTVKMNELLRLWDRVEQPRMARL